MISLTIIHVGVYTNLSIAEEYSIVGMYHILFVHKHIEEPLSCLQFGTFTNIAIMNICEQVFI